MNINASIIRKSAITVDLLKAYGYTAKVYKADDRRFETKRMDADIRWSTEIFDAAAEFLRNGVQCKMQANLQEMTMEMVISDTFINVVPMIAILSRPMTDVEALEAGQEQRKLLD